MHTIGRTPSCCELGEFAAIASTQDDERPPLRARNRFDCVGETLTVPVATDEQCDELVPADPEMGPESHAPLG
jgi:hypothetical protein